MRFDSRPDVALAVPGAHNALNAAAALRPAAPPAPTSPRPSRRWPTSAARAAASSASARRAGRAVFDDYAHHPTEVAATLEAARTLAPRRVVAVFQPHLYSRTRGLDREFGDALARADVGASSTSTRPASGPRTSPASPAAWSPRRRRRRRRAPVYWLPDFAAAEPVLRGLLRAGDLCLSGAGDIDALGRRLVAPGRTPGG